MKTKMIALLLAVVLAFGCLAGCGDNDSSSSSGTSSSAGSSVSSSNSKDTSAVDKYTLAYEKYSPDEVVMTVNGHEVTWEEYYCWLYSICSQLEYQMAYYYGTTIDWSAAIDEEYTYQESVLEYVDSMVSQYIIIEDAFNDAGLTLSEENQASLDSALQTAADNNTDGDLDTFLQQLSELFISEDYYLYTCAVSLYYDELFAQQFGADGSALSDEDALAYIKDNGYMYAKHILFMTVDDSGSALDEETVAQKKADAEAVLAQLKACATTEEMLALFDTLQAEWNEDTGREYYTDGYYFLEGEMVTAFEDAAKSLEDNQLYPEVVESPYGYHIILRPAMDPEHLMEPDGTGSGYTVRYMAAANLFDGITADWFENAEIVYTDEFASMQLNELFAEAE